MDPSIPDPCIFRPLQWTGFVLALSVSGCFSPQLHSSPKGSRDAASSETAPPETEAPNSSASPSPASKSQASVPLITSSSTSIGIGKKLNVSVSGGIPPYILSTTLGSISQGGIYTAPLQTGSATLKVQDSLGTLGSTTVQVIVESPQFPNDSLFFQLSGLHQTSGPDIDGPEGWGIHTDCRAMSVAILDTGIDFTHPDLASNIYVNPKEIPNNGIDDDANGWIDDVRGWNFVDGTASAMDDNLHGTHVAGIIGAIGDNNSGVTGICWKASLIPVKFLDDEGAGFNSDAIEGIDYAISIGAKVINASFGSSTYSANFKDAIDRAAAAGVLFVTAAGNDGANNDSTDSYPANYTSPNILSVAAVTASDALASFSNYGATRVHLAAPGASILSTFPTTATPQMTAIGKTSSYEKVSGTSMAAPYVAGAAALLRSFDPTLTYAAARSRILNGADTIPGLSGKVAGSRRLNLRKTLYAE